MGEFIKLGGSSGSGGSSTFDGLSDKASVDLPGINSPLANALSGKEVTANKKTDVDANKTSNTFFPTVKAVFDWVSGLFVKGAASSTDNAVARFDGVTGKVVQDSSVAITDAGSVGIGTMSPLSKLHIVDSVFDVKVAAAGDYGALTAKSTGSGGGTAFNIFNDLDVRFGLYSYGSAEPGYFLGMPRANKTAVFNIAGATASAMLIGTYEANPVVLGTTGTERLRIDSNGNVGIGTASPTAKLDVKGSGATNATTALRVRNSNNVEMLKVVDNGVLSSTAVVELRNGYGGGCLSIGADANGTELTLNTRKLGRISFPSYHNTLPITVLSCDSLVTDDVLEIGGRQGTDTVSPNRILFSTSAIRGDKTTNATHMTILSSGNIGIGESVPTAKLDINGTCRMRNNATFDGQIIDNVGSSGVDGQVLKKVGGLVIWANP